MQNRENYKKNTLKSPLNPNLVAQSLKTPERVWMAILLINQHQETPTIEEFSKLSNLSLGFISKFANILRDAGFLAKGRTLNLLEPGQLLDIVRDTYLFEANQIISYYAEGSAEEILKNFKTANKSYALTRMCGASFIAPFVRYQLIDFYIPNQSNLAYWKEKLKLIDVELSGNVNLVIPQNPRIFNQVQKFKGYNIVNNIQLYLDLYKYPARGREQAEHLREQVIKI
ncbi:MAG: hypothetical protein ABIE74_08695 [Pseudomonadota bacterium]